MMSSFVHLKRHLCLGCRNGAGSAKCQISVITRFLNVQLLGWTCVYSIDNLDLVPALIVLPLCNCSRVMSIRICQC
jgi:hypothetical protein